MCAVFSLPYSLHFFIYLSPVLAVKSGVPQTFKINTVGSNAPEKMPSVAIKQAGVGKVIPTTLKKTPQGYEVDYILPTPGMYTAQVFYDQFPVAGPFNVEAIPSAQPVPAKGTKPAQLAAVSMAPGMPVNPLVAKHNDTLYQAGLVKPTAVLKTGQIVPMDIASPQMATPVKRATILSPLQASIKMPEEVMAQAMMNPQFTQQPEPLNAPQQVIANQPLITPQNIKPVAAPFSSKENAPESSLLGPGQYGNPRPPVLPEDKVGSYLNVCMVAWRCSFLRNACVGWKMNFATLKVKTNVFLFVMN